MNSRWIGSKFLAILRFEVMSREFWINPWWIHCEFVVNFPIRNKERKQRESRGEISENGEKSEKSEISDLFLIGFLWFPVDLYFVNVSFTFCRLWGNCWPRFWSLIMSCSKEHYNGILCHFQICSWIQISSIFWQAMMTFLSELQTRHNFSCYAIANQNQEHASNYVDST